MKLAELRYRFTINPPEAFVKKCDFHPSGVRPEGPNRKFRLMFIPFVFLLALINFAGCFCSATSETPSGTPKTQAPARSDSAPVAPSIISQPTSQTVNTGQTATFTVVATGTAPLTYQWLLNGVRIAGATSSAYTTPPAAVADNKAQFAVTIGNPIGSATSSSATLTVNVLSRPAQSTASPPPRNRQVRTSRILSNSYVGLQVGYINYAFANAQLQPGFQAQSVQVPHLAARVVLFGHEFGKYFSAQLSVMRPVQWVVYHNVNGNLGSASVWMNIGGLTAKARLPLNERWSMFGEGGLGIVTRKGFEINQSP